MYIAHGLTENSCSISKAEVIAQTPLTKSKYACKQYLNAVFEITLGLGSLLTNSCYYVLGFKTGKSFSGFSQGSTACHTTCIQHQCFLGVEVFTFGVQSGNVEELNNIASTPKDDHVYILASFAEFEAVARRALHAG